MLSTEPGVGLNHDQIRPMKQVEHGIEQAGKLT